MKGNQLTENEIFINLRNQKMLETIQRYLKNKHEITGSVLNASNRLLICTRMRENNNNGFELKSNRATIKSTRITLT